MKTNPNLQFFRNQNVKEQYLYHHRAAHPHTMILSLCCILMDTMRTEDRLLEEVSLRKHQHHLVDVDKWIKHQRKKTGCGEMRTIPTFKYSFQKNSYLCKRIKRMMNDENRNPFSAYESHKLFRFNSLETTFPFFP